MFHFKIESIRREIEGVYSIVLHPVEDGFTYLPGQFITFFYHHHGKEVRRSYSFSSIPSEPLTITVKRQDNGVFSRYLIDRAKVGDVLLGDKAAGFFILPVSTSFEQVFLFTAGSGITPVFSILKHLLFHCPDKKVVLIYSNSARDKTIFYDELIHLADDYKDRFILYFLFSNSAHLLEARLSKARVGELLQAYSISGSGRLHYICGPRAYMFMVGYGLVEAGVPDEAIKKEIFSFEKKEIRAKPLDTGKHTVNITIGSNTYSANVKFPESILHSALAMGVPLPYSCEVGQCGRCAAICTSGNIWMSQNEVLTPTDLKNSLVLTCTGFPIGGDVSLTIL